MLKRARRTSRTRLLMRDDLGRAGTLEGEAFSQTSNMPTHSEVMAKTLAESGVKYVFGLPGGEITAFIDSCRRADIRFLLAGHESSAALMAQVMGQITGTPGVCAATLGPGATNLVTGVTNAFLDRSPLLAVVAQMPNSVFESMTHQRVARVILG